MKINPNVATYKATTPPLVKDQKNIEDSEKKVKEPKQDSYKASKEGKVFSQKDIEKITQQQEASFNNMLSDMVGKQGKTSKIADYSDLMKQIQKVTGNEDLSNVTPEQAAFNISEEGPYGVKAVATNIMDMAIALSGGDSEKMETLKGAVMKGFEAAGIELGTGKELSKLPQVSQDTYTEVMKRFDHFEKSGSMDSYEYTPYE